MTDAERLSRLGQKGRLCASCAGLIVQWRPVFLVGDTDGKILGPYHASCAEKIAIARKLGKKNGRIRAELFGRIVPKSRDQEPDR